MSRSVCACVAGGGAEKEQTRPRFRVPEQVFPEIVVVLFFGKVDCTADVSQSVDDEVQRLLVVTHAAKQEHHLQHQVTLVADFVRLCA